MTWRGTTDAGAVGTPVEELTDPTLPDFFDQVTLPVPPVCVHAAPT